MEIASYAQRGNPPLYSPSDPQLLDVGSTSQRVLPLRVLPQRGTPPSEASAFGRGEYRCAL